MNIKINLGIWDSVFCVPSAVADKYLKTARGSDIKVLLFLLRHSGESFSSEAVGERLGLTAEQVEESVEFWKQREIIGADETGELSALLKINVETTREETSAALAREQTETIGTRGLKPVSESLVHKINLERTPDFPPVEIARTVRGNEKADYLFKHCEMLYGRPLKHSEQQTLMIILEDACLPVEAALILVDYCFSVDKATPAYMRTMAAEWAESDISTIEKAEQRVEELKRLDGAVGRFKKMFEVNSAFSKQQKEFIGRWINLYGFSDEMISEAYQITLNGAGKLSFPYMNKILENWYGKGIKSKEQIETDKKPKAAVKGENSSLDIKRIEQLMSDKYKKSGGSL